jgi:hypothetical protein
MTGCQSAAKAPQPLSTPTLSPSVSITPQEKKVMSASALAQDLQQALLKIVAQEQNVAAGVLKITQVEEADWPNACLGLPQAGEFCAQMITPGWAVTVTNGQQTWRYHTDLDMMQVRLAK